MVEAKGCLLLHGFTGGPYELAPLAEHMQSRGWNCSVPTLAGHEGPHPLMHRIRGADWIASAAEEAAKLEVRYGTFDLVGFSMGGLIAAFLANRFPVRRLVLLSAAVYYLSPARFLRNARAQLRRGRFEDVFAKKGTPFSAVIEFARTVRDLKPELARLRVPTMIVQGEEDEIVHPRSAAYIYKTITGEKELVWVPNARHMICHSPEAEKLFLDIERFFKGKAAKE